MCPLDGMHDVVEEYAKGCSYSDVIKKIEAKQPDFDTSAMKADREFFIIKNGRPPKRIEELEKEVRKYLGEIIYSVTRHNKGSTKEDAYLYKYGRAFADDETGELVEESTSKSRYKGITRSEWSRWEKQIPYILKRLHERSKEIGLSMMSGVIAYCKCIKTSTYRVVKPSELLGQGIYKMHSSGNLMEIEGKYLLQEDNKGKFSEYMYDILIGNDKTDPLYDQIQELLDICDRVGIELSHEDPRAYDEKFISELVITYVTKNREYMCTRYNPGSIQHIRKLKFSQFEEDKKSMLKSDKHNPINLKRKVLNTMQMFLDSEETEIADRRDSDDAEFIPNILYYLHELTGGKYVESLDELYLSRGFLAKENGSPYLVDMSIFTNGNTNSKCVIHRSGFMLCVTDEEVAKLSRSMRWIDTKLAWEFLQDFMEKGYAMGYDLYDMYDCKEEIILKLTEKEYKKRRKYGTWYTTEE